MKTLMEDIVQIGPWALALAGLAVLLVSCATTGPCGRWREAGSVGDATICRGARATVTGMETCEKLVDDEGNVVAERCTP